MTFIHGKETTVKTPKGSLRGYYKDGIYHFLGVQYGSAKRFMAPVETEAWEDVKEATSYGYTAKLMMKETPGNDLACPHRFWPQSEDCQNLNIWTGAISNAKKPVVVWLHGGGFFAGSAIEQISYDGFNMAKYGDVVCVTVNHRLNVAGYLDLRKKGEKYVHSINAGSLDLVMALKWISQNIEYFGGDPKNVTIFGQSGGGGKVISLMNMPEADGLFHKAMIMSGTLGDFLTDENVDTTPIVDQCIKNLGITDVEEIESVDYDQLCQAYALANKQLGYRGLPLFTPQRGVDYLGDPMFVGFSENAKKIPVMIGSTFAEFNSLDKKYSRSMSEQEMIDAIHHQFGEMADQLIESFRKTYPNNPIIDILTYDDGAFRYSVKKWVEKRIEENCADTYMYLFKPEMKINETSTANHCADIAYVFHNTDLVDSSDIGEKTKDLEKEIFSRFMSFVKTGNVNNEEYIGWLTSDKVHQYTYVYDENSYCAEDLDDEFLTLLRKAKKPFSIHDFTVE